MFVFALVMLFACAHSPELDVNQLDFTGEEDEIVIGDKKISRDAGTITSDDAIKVAKLYKKSKVGTRTARDLVIRNVVSINGSDGSPALFAVNFEEGYVIISATMDYYPILADVDKGVFSFEDMEKTGQRLILNDYISHMAALSKIQDNWEARSLWEKYIDADPESVDVLKTKASDDFDAELDNLLCKGDDPCVSVILLKNCKNSLPSELYNKYISIAEESDRWYGTEYSWENTAYVVRYKTPETMYPPMPFISTQWSQGYPYNISGYENLGCVTIAVGQLMKYYRIPNSFNWNAMPDNGTSTELCNFLKNLRAELQITVDGKGSNERAMQVLRNYGYNCSIQNHDMGKLMSYLMYQAKPVYAYGADLRDKDNPSAHAWVIDGCSNTDKYVEYSLYVLSPRAYPDFEFEIADDCSPERYYIQNGVTSFHMNWGWGGLHDGWYVDHNMSTSVGSYNSYRKEIYFY